jgi:hypothetical protein
VAIGSRRDDVESSVEDSWDRGDRIQGAETDEHAPTTPPTDGEAAISFNELGTGSAADSHSGRAMRCSGRPQRLAFGSAGSAALMPQDAGGFSEDLILVECDSGGMLRVARDRSAGDGACVDHRFDRRGGAPRPWAEDAELNRRGRHAVNDPYGDRRLLLDVGSSQQLNLNR